MSDKKNLLITAISSKMGLLRAFREIPVELRGVIVGTDMDEDAPARELCDHFVQVSPTDTEEHWKEIEEICVQFSIRSVVPTREEDLRFWRLWGDERAPAGVEVVNSDPFCLMLCCDKWMCYKWLVDNGFAVPETWLPSEIPDAAFEQPLIAKKREGAGSRDVRFIASADEMKRASLDDEWILQTVQNEREYTINLFVDKSGRCLTVIPHRRDKVVGGEVAEGQTVDAKVLIDLGQRLVATLPGVWGPLNFQVFWGGTADHPARITDINPRFGGGYHLCHAAGGTFTHWIVDESLGKPLPEKPLWRAGLKMVRKADESLFLS